MTHYLPEPFTDYKGQVIAVILPSRNGLKCQARVVGVDLATRSLEVLTEYGLELVPALLGNFVFYSDEINRRLAKCSPEVVANTNS